MQEQLQLHDIKPLLEVQEYSLYYFIFAIVFGAIFLFGAFFLLWRWYKNRKKVNIRLEHFEEIKKLNLSDTKQSAYALTHYGATFRDDSPRHSEMYKNLTTRLEKYKYKKEVEPFDSEVTGYIELYKGMIDV